MVTWADCAKRLDEIGVYDKIAEDADTGLSIDIGCGQGYFLKALYSKNPSAGIIGADDKLSACRQYLKTEKVPFSDITAKEVGKKAGKLKGIWLVEENYRKMPKRLFDSSFLLFPSILGYDMEKASTDEKHITLFLRCAQLLQRVMLASAAAKLGGSVTLATLAGPGEATEYKRTGLLDRIKGENIPVSDRAFTKLYREYHGVNDEPYIYTTTGMAKEIDPVLAERINKLDIISSKQTMVEDLGKDIGIYYSTGGKFFKKDKLIVPKEFINWVLSCFSAEE
jgi:hypothetical protein